MGLGTKQRSKGQLKVNNCMRKKKEQAGMGPSRVCACKERSSPATVGTSLPSSASCLMFAMNPMRLNAMRPRRRPCICVPVTALQMGVGHASRTFASGLALSPLLQELFLELARAGSVVVVTSLVQLFY